jgi:hypothetical protein
LVIGLFAKLIGLGDLAKRVQKIFKKIRKRVDKVVRDLFKKAKKAGRKLMRKLGIGKKKKGSKPEDDKRTPAEMKKDLHAGVKEGTEFIKGGQKTKKEINTKLKKLEDKYLLEELKFVSDKENKVHIHGKVNPDEDGPKIDWNVDESTTLTDEEIKKLKSIKGGVNTINKIQDLYNQSDKTNYINLLKEVRVMMSLSNEVLFVGASIKAKPSFEVFFEKDNKSGIEKLGEIDILTQTELIEIKSDWKNKDGLSQGNRDQFQRLRNLVNGKPPIFDENRSQVTLSDKRLVLQLETFDISPRLLVDIKKGNYFDLIRLGNGNEIIVADLVTIKPSTLKDARRISNALEYNSLK